MLEYIEDHPLAFVHGSAGYGSLPPYPDPSPIADVMKIYLTVMGTAASE